MFRYAYAIEVLRIIQPVDIRMLVVRVTCAPEYLSTFNGP